MSTPNPSPKKPPPSAADEPTMMPGKVPLPTPEPEESDDMTYVYKPSEIAAIAGRGKPTTIGLLSLIDSSVIQQDLTRDALLEKAPRIEVDGKTVPALGGIPLFAMLGHGAMGAVYYGVDPKTRTSVALKVFPLAMTNQAAMERLYEQVRHIKQLKSKYLVSIREINREAELCYLVMEYVAGISAAGYAQRIRASTGANGITEAIALDICIAATDGLAEAHRNGIMHGDIRPQNIFIPRKGSDVFLFAESKLTDLGIPRIEELGGLVSGEHAPMGQPGYMAPEQAVDATAARKPADVFGIGATLYTLLAGKPPFEADNPMNAILASIQSEHQPVSTLRKDVSPATSELIDRCLAKQPGDRFADGSALLEALSVCRVALTGTKVTQPSAIKKMTMVLEKAEVGKKIIGTGAEHTPSKIDFEAAIGNPGATMTKKPGMQTVPKPSPAATLIDRPRGGTSLQMKPDTMIVPPPPSATASGERPATAAPADGGLGGLLKILVAMVVLLVLALGGIVVFRKKSEASFSPLQSTHAALLTKAREKVKDDPSMARGFLESAKELAIADPKAKELEAGVTALVEAYELFSQDKDVLEIEKALLRAEKVLPNEPAIARLRGRIDEKSKKPEK